jgi:CubicO group peptidase (beta-lactamase class C family)
MTSNSTQHFGNAHKAFGKTDDRSFLRFRSRATLWTGAILLVAALACALVLHPIRAAKIAAGLAAHNLCSAVFVAGLDPDAALREQVSVFLKGPVGWLLKYRVDRVSPGVETSMAEIVHARASFSPGYGCRLDYPDNLPAPASPPLASGGQNDAFASDGPVHPVESGLSAAIDKVFAEDVSQPVKNVKAVVVVRDGRMIGERYAPGFGVNTPLLSYSVAKSFTNALAGILTRQGRLRVDQPVEAPEWTDPGDPRSRITVEDLLRMRSGLDVEEAESGLSPVAEMEYAHSDMAAFAARHSLKDPPGAIWEYTSADTLILDRLLGRIVGGGAAGMRQFAERELFAPLNMRDVTMEFDGSGTFVGSSFVFAPARAYARLGELYLNDGVASDGARILPAGWAAWSRGATLGAPYGAGFWTNDGPSRIAARRVGSGFPKDGFFASGVLGQRIYIVPSAHVVVARFGYSNPPDYGIKDDLALIDAAVRSGEGYTDEVEHESRPH